MSLVDALSNLTGATKKTKLASITRLSDSLAQVENHIVENISDEWINENIPAEVSQSISAGHSVLLRLSNRIKTNYTDEIADDMFFVGKALMVLKAVIVVESGWKLEPGKKNIQEFGAKYPDLLEFLNVSEDEAVIHAKEAINTIDHLAKKYPY